MQYCMVHVYVLVYPLYDFFFQVFLMVERIHVCVHLYLLLCLWLKYMYLLVAIYKASKLHCV